MAFYAIYWLDNPDVNLWTQLWGYNYFGRENVAHIKTGTEGIFGALLLDNNQYSLILLSHEPKTFDISYEAGTITAYPGLTMTNSQYSNAYYHIFSRYGNAAYSHYLDIYSSLDEMLLAFSKSGKTNPYAPGGTSGPGGGTGTFELINDSIDFPMLPTLGALNAGFVSIWTPTLEQVQKLAAYMWTTDITKSSFWKNLVQSPLELIFSLSIMPVAEGTPGTELKLGWINTGIWTNYRESQYYEVDCGSIDMKEYWGAFFDYEPYTKVSIYLPYIGVKELGTNDIMGRVVALKYNIDLATGACVAMIKCDDAVYYHFVGSCAVQIPITAANLQEVIKGITQASAGAATAVMAAVAPPAGAAAATAALVGGAAAGFGGLYKAVTGFNVNRSSAFTGNAGFMSVQKPYLIISRPRQAMPEDQQVYTGFPAFMTKKLSDVSGYTEVQMIHLHNLSCTDDERAEIDELLKEGVIF